MIRNERLKPLEPLSRLKKLKFTNPIIFHTVMTNEEIKAQIKILEVLMDHLCTCELTEKGREGTRRLIEKLKTKLNKKES